MGIKIIGTGKYLPEKVITNEDISQHVDTSHEWILDRTGIEQRRIATTESKALRSRLCRESIRIPSALLL